MVLTAWQVVSGNNRGEELAIFTPDGKEHQLEQGSIQRLGQVDMAVLTFSSGGAYEVAEVGDIKKVKYDDPIYVAGFPTNNSQTLRYEPGVVVANAEVGIDQGYQLAYDNETLPGMSGGVLLNSHGELVGIHGRGERDDQASSGKEYVIKTGVNAGVPITFYNLYTHAAPIVAASEVPTTVDDYLAMAISSLGVKGRDKTIIRLVDQSLKLRPSKVGRVVTPYYMRAISKFNLNDYQGAIADYDRVIEENNYREFKIDLRGYLPISAIRLVYAYNNRGVAKGKSGDAPGAISDYNKAIEINPQHFNAYLNRGNAKSESGDHQGAISDYNKAIEINPLDPKSYYNRGYVKIGLIDYRGAIKDFTRALEINPHYPDANLYRGHAKSRLGDYEGAIVIATGQ